MDTTTSCEPICGARASPRSSAKRSRKPDLPIYVPKQVRERQKVLDVQETPRRVTCGSVCGVIPSQQINTNSLNAEELDGTTDYIDSMLHVNTNLDKSIFRDTVIGVSVEVQGNVNETDKAQKSECTSAVTVDVSTKVIDAMIMREIEDVNVSATRRDSDLGDSSLSIISNKFASKCTLADDTDSQVQIITEPQICDADNEKCARTSADAVTPSSDEENESFRDQERERLRNATGAVEVSGFPAEFNERDVRNMVHFGVERIVWVNDTCCVCVFDFSADADSADASAITSTDVLIELLRERLAMDAPCVRVVPLVEADASSKRKWMFVERHRRSFRAETEPVPPRPRTSAVVANRMILRALGKTAEQCAAAND